METFIDSKSEIRPISNIFENQEWNKKCRYKIKTWKKNQSYEGEFLRDSLHGEGTYRWNNSEVFEGSFYSNFKEGYGALSFSDNSYFEGLFVKNKPFGPGILTHANGRQDAGFWVGRKLVRLSRPVDYIVPRLAPTSAAKIKLLQFRRLIPLNESDFNSATEILERHGNLNNCHSPYSELIYDPRSLFFDKLTFENTYFANATDLLRGVITDSNDLFLDEDTNFENDRNVDKESNITYPPQCLCGDGVFEMNYTNDNKMSICDEKVYSSDNEMGILAYYSKYGTLGKLQEMGKISESRIAIPNLSFEEKVDFSEEERGQKNSLPAKIVSWNRSELCTEMLKQIFRYRTFEEKLNLQIAQLMLGARTAFRRTGEKEKKCLQFLKMCSLGPLYVVKELLCTAEISEDLMDARGNNSLMFAAATDQHNIIDLLLDYGVNVNTFNDESLTPLNLCLLRRLAQTYRISNWETAFLPSEPNKNLSNENEPPPTEWRRRESVQSLDRIFGDGMSMNDSDGFFDETPPNEMCNTTEDVDISNSSVITILNIKRQSDNNNNNPKNNEYNPVTVKMTSTKIKTKIVPKTPQRDEFEQSILKSSKDSYLFELSFDKSFPADNYKKSQASNKLEKKKTIDLEPKKEKPNGDPDLIAKIENIDKTIEKLLCRGADPNVSEVPKPSIHLGIYTKELSIVNILLLFGANPDSRLHFNEGFLTPLHVLTLLNPAKEFVDICQLLLNFGANPEEETLPEFSISENETNLLDPLHGRTPLQLLCMRPDLELVDTDGFLIKIALLLGKVCNKKHFFKGHSYITLTMFCGNIKLLTALLNSKYFNPNEVLGKDLGTALHVLVSTDFQIKTLFSNSIKMCDLLLEAGANPLKEFKKPQALLGTCVDYGLREIEKEKNRRKCEVREKKTVKSPSSDKKGGRDYLKDHIKVVEYLGKRAKDLREGKNIIQTRDGSVGKEDESKQYKDAFKVTSKKSQDYTKSDDPNKKSQKSLDGSFNQEDQKSGDKKSEREELDFLFENAKDKQKEKKQLNETETREEKEKKKLGKTEFSESLKAGKNQKASKKGMSKSLSSKHSEMFPEKLRQTLLKIFGNCADIDINEFFLPYVVLRDGNLYYRFQGKGSDRIEQYSLV